MRAETLEDDGAGAEAGADLGVAEAMEARKERHASKVRVVFSHGARALTAAPR